MHTIPSTKTQNLGNDVAAKSDELLRSGQTMARDAYDTVNEKLEQARDTAPMALSRAAARMESLARQGLDRAKATSREVRGQLSTAGDRTVGYIKTEPVKSVLIAAATGALVAGALMALSSRRGSNRW